MTDVVLLGRLHPTSKLEPEPPQSAGLAHLYTRGGETQNGTGSALDPRSSSSLSPVPTASRDRRYGTARWQKVRLRVLNRDLWACRVVDACPVRASVADHVIPVTPGMPNALFFDPGSLRAACRGHNLARGFAATLDDERKPAPSAVVTTDYTVR